MRIYQWFIGSIAISLSLTSSAIAQDVDANTIVASINGTDITVGHMIVLRNNLPEQYQSLDNKVLFDGILDQVIQQTVLAQSISEPSPAIALQLENERRSLLAGDAMGKLLAQSITDEAVEAAYNEQYAEITPSREFNASHILVETEEEAIALVLKLEDGSDFSELAQEFSTGPSGPNGGQLGWFGPGMMVPPFEEAVVELEDGQISAPVQTQFGWHVIILNESRMESAPAIDDVRAEIVEGLQQKTVEGILEELVSKADITKADLSAIDPAVLLDTDLVQN